MRKAIGLWVAMMMAVMTMYAQEEYHVKNYGINDDLKVRGGTCITQVNGFVWIGTSTGFFAFDGHHIHPYYVPDEEGLGGFYSRVTALAPTTGDVLWVGSQRGIYEFNFNDERMHPFTAEGLPERPGVQALLFDQEGYLWAILNGQAYKIDVEKKRAECVGEGQVSPSCIMQAKNGSIWLGDNNGVLYRYDSANHRLRSYDIKPEGVEKFMSLVSITEMRSGELALVSNTDGVCLFSPKKLTSRMLLTRDDEGTPILAHTSITTNGDDLWLGTERGVVIYNMREKRVKGIRHSRLAANSLSDNAVHSLYLDEEEGVWAGTFFGGMNRISLSPNNFTVALTEDSNDDTDVVREICGDNYGHLWVGTEDGGLYLYDKEKNVIRVANVAWGGNPLPFNIQALMLVGDELWVSSNTNGIYVVDTKSMKLIRRYEKTEKTAAGRPLGGITMCQQNGSIFVGTRGGCYIFDEKEQRFNMIPEMRGVYSHHLMADSKGNVWVASFNKGLWKITQKNGKWKAEQTPFEYKCITVIMEDSRGGYWVGTDLHGLMFYDDKTGKAKQLETSEQLKQETVTNIVEDLHHRLWINTFNGLYSYNLARKVANHITTANGLPSSYLNYSSGYVDPEGVVYIGTYKGMIVFNPTNFIMLRERLRPYFLTLTVNGKHIIPNDETGILKATLFQTKEVKLTRDQNTFSIDYAVPTYRSGEIVWYRYRLNPDEPWVVTDRAQPIQLSNLSTGTYRITLQASYNPERWEGESALLIVKVDTPIWLSPFAFIGYVIIIILVVVGIMSFLKKVAIKKLTEEQNAQAEELEEWEEKNS